MASVLDARVPRLAMEGRMKLELQVILLSSVLGLALGLALYRYFAERLRGPQGEPRPDVAEVSASPVPEPPQ